MDKDKLKEIRAKGYKMNNSELSGYRVVSFRKLKSLNKRAIEYDYNRSLEWKAIDRDVRRGKINKESIFPLIPEFYEEHENAMRAKIVLNECGTTAYIDIELSEWAKLTTAVQVLELVDVLGESRYGETKLREWGTTQWT